MENITIDFLFENENVAFQIIWNTEYHNYKYTSPFLFNTTEEAYLEALNYLAK